MNSLIGTIYPPKLPPNVPEDAQWLGGEGVGTWFHLSKPANLAENEYRIRRYSPNGTIECDRIFVPDPEAPGVFDIGKPYEFTYISHCRKCSIVQNHRIITFTYVG